jgi:hypothetical protein
MRDVPLTLDGGVSDLGHVGDCEAAGWISRSLIARCERSSCQWMNAARNEKDLVREEKVRLGGEAMTMEGKTERINFFFCSACLLACLLARSALLCSAVQPTAHPHRRLCQCQATLPGFIPTPARRNCPSRPSAHLPICPSAHLPICPSATQCHTFPSRTCLSLKSFGGKTSTLQNAYQRRPARCSLHSASSPCSRPRPALLVSTLTYSTPSAPAPASRVSTPAVPGPRSLVSGLCHLSIRHLHPSRIASPSPTAGCTALHRPAPSSTSIISSTRAQAQVGQQEQQQQHKYNPPNQASCRFVFLGPTSNLKFHPHRQPPTSSIHSSVAELEHHSPCNLSPTSAFCRQSVRCRPPTTQLPAGIDRHSPDPLYFSIHPSRNWYGSVAAPDLQHLPKP